MSISSTTPRKIIDAPATMRSLNCSRWKLWDLCRNDDDFPKPRTIAGKRSWFVDELERYKESRPCRQYADSTA
jgi:predicted DNA-binding transcriptional regulator AlpA